MPRRWGGWVRARRGTERAGPPARKVKNGADARAIRRDQAGSGLGDIMKIKLKVQLEQWFASCALLMARRQQRQYVGRLVTGGGGGEMFEWGDDDHAILGRCNDGLRCEHCAELTGPFTRFRPSLPVQHRPSADSHG